MKNCKGNLEERIIRLKQKTFDILEANIPADCRFITAKYLCSLLFYTADGKRIIFTSDKE